ncbi:MAG: nickel-dependent lactate racemase [Bacillota bacterium]
MNITLNFAKEKQTIDIPDKNILQILVPNEFEAGLINEDEIEWALDNPIESLPIEELFSAEDTVAVVIGATIRPDANKIVLPQILCRLALAGVKAENITVVVALGGHPKHSEAEMIVLVGADLFDSYRCVDAGSDGYLNVGTASNGTEFEMCKHVVDAAKRICIATIEYHILFGYSGGAVTLIPGVSSAATVASLLQLVDDVATRSGSLQGNPVRTTIDEIMDHCPVTFILNVVLDEQKRIIKAVAGDCDQAHRVGCEFLDSIYKIPIAEQADIVLVSAGGWPNDIDFARAQKALDHAQQAVAGGGTIILLAACSEGVGNAMPLPALATTETCIVSDLSPATIAALFIKGYEELEFAFDVALAKYGADAKVIVIPYGVATLPQLEN